MLTIKGKVVSVRPQTIKTKAGASFVVNHVFLVNGGDPIRVKFGDRAGAVPAVGKDVAVDVYVRAFALKGGGAGYDLIAYDSEARK